MIYEAVEAGEEIKQGDIFIDVPVPDFTFGARGISIFEPATKESSLITWQGILDEKKDRLALVPIRLISGVIINQDCDASREERLCLAEIDEFEKVCGENLSSSPVKAIRYLTKKAKINLKWFYLPIDPLVGFSTRKAADFCSLYPVYRDDLKKMIQQRKGRLKSPADEHFREKLSEFFRRYAYNEWYPLTKAECDIYDSDNSGSNSRYDWQR